MTTADQSEYLRLRALDAVRIFGCYGIVAYHFLPYVGGDEGWLFWPFRNASVFVDVFFVVSGVVIAHNYAGKTGTFESYLRYLGKRVARLYPLHLATLLFYTVIGLAALGGYLNVASSRKYDFSEWIPNALMLHAWGFSSDTAFNYPSWTISAEMFAYMLFPLVLACAARSVATGLALIVVLFALGIIVAEVFVGRHLTHLTVPYSIFRALPGFATGVVLYMNRGAFPVLKDAYMRTAVYLSLAAFTLLMTGNAPPYLVLASAVMFVALTFAADHQRTLLFFGGAGTSRHAELTYSLYMLHAPVATVLLAFAFPKVLGGWFQEEAVVRLLCVLASVAAAVALSWASYHYFETPVRMRLSGQPPRRGLERPSLGPAA